MNLLNPLDLLPLAQELQEASTINDANELMVKSGQLDQYFALLSMGELDAANQFPGLLGIKEHFFKLIIHCNPRTRHQYLAAKVSEQADNSLLAIDTMSGRLHLDKEEADALKHHRAMVDMGIKVNQAEANIGEGAGKNNQIIFNNNVTVADKQEAPPPPPILEGIYEEID